METYPIVADGAPDFPALIDYCTGVDRAENLHELACQLGDRDFCFEDFQNFFIDRLLRNCNEGAKETYYIDQPVGLEFTFDIDERGDLLEGTINGVLNMGSYEYNGDAAHADLVQSAIVFTDWGVDVSISDVLVDPRSHIVETLTTQLDIADADEVSAAVTTDLADIESTLGPIGDAGYLVGSNPYGGEIFAWAINIPSENKIVLYEIRAE